MNTTYDVVVLGLGANGSSAVYQLSKTGCNVLGIDRFKPPHTKGSSHGQSRIIRQAYHENPLYVPFVKEAYTLWKEIEKTSGRDLLLRTGGIILGCEDAAVVKGAVLSAETHNLPYQLLTHTEIKSRFPALNPSPDTTAILDADAGILFPEKCIQAFLEQAQQNGATLRYNEPVIRIRPTEDVVEINTGKHIYRAAKLIVSAGAWLSELMPELSLPLTIERQVLYWLKSKKPGQNFTPANLPVYIWEYKADHVFYGFPDLGDGLKMAFHQGGKIITPDTLTQDTSGAEIASMIKIAETYLNMEAVFNYATTCMYTNTPDTDFIIDFHPYHQNIIIASPCSGHGFKFASLTGKILCQMAIGKPVPFDLSPFRINRF